MTKFVIFIIFSIFLITNDITMTHFSQIMIILSCILNNLMRLELRENKVMVLQLWGSQTKPSGEDLTYVSIQLAC